MTAIGTAPTEIEIAIRYSDEELFGEDAYRLRTWAWRRKIPKKMKQVLYACGYEPDDIFQESRLWTLRHRPKREFKLATVIVKGFIWSTHKLVERLYHPKRCPPGGRLFQLVGDFPDREQIDYEDIHSIDEDVHELVRSIAKTNSQRTSRHNASSTQRLVDILFWRYGLESSEMTLEECGKKLGITRERVRQLEVLALDALKATPEAYSIAASLGWNVGEMPTERPPTRYFGRQSKKKRDPKQNVHVPVGKRARNKEDIVAGDVDSTIADAILKKMGYTDKSPCCQRCRCCIQKDMDAYSTQRDSLCILNPAFSIPVCQSGHCDHFQAKP